MARWNSEQGKKCVLDALNVSSFDVVASNPEFWSSLKAFSVLPLRCRECGAHAWPTVKKFVKNRSAACFCNGQARWASVDGHNRLKDVVEQSRFRLKGNTVDSRWFSLNASCSMCLDLECTVCHHSPERTQLRHFVNTGSAACWCNGQATWASADGHDRLIEALKVTRFEPCEMMRGQEWFVKNCTGEHFNIPIRCTVCGVLPTDATISNFVRNMSAKCGCQSKTENMVLSWLESTSKEVVIEREYCFPGHVSPANRRLPFDCAIVKDNKPILCVEIDGRQHFDVKSVKGTHMHSDVENRMKIDRIKEMECCSRGVPIARLYQEDVWAGRFDWRRWLSKIVQEATDGTLKVLVHCQPGCAVYARGAFANMREGCRV